MLCTIHPLYSLSYIQINVCSLKLLVVLNFDNFYLVHVRLLVAKLKLSDFGRNGEFGIVFQ